MNCTLAEVEDPEVDVAVDGVLEDGPAVGDVGVDVAVDDEAADNVVVNDEAVDNAAVDNVAVDGVGVEMVIGVPISNPETFTHMVLK